MKLVLAALAAALVVTSAASASPSIRFGVQDDAYLAPGPSLEPNLLTLDQLGAGLVRYLVNWRQVAPTKPRHPADPGDPAYDWTAADATLGALHARGITVLATLVRTPAWANGGLAQNAAPTSKYALAAFAVAVAKRYPWLHLWEIWNEPNLQSFLKPNSPRLYVQRLLNPAYVELQALDPANRIAGGATSPRSTSTGALAGRVHARHVRGARPARRLLAPPVRGHARRDAVRLRPRRLPLLHRRADDGEPGEADPGGEARLRAEADLADRVRLRDEPARPERRLVGLAGAGSSRRRRNGRQPRRTSTCSSSSCSRTKAGRTAGRAG